MEEDPCVACTLCRVTSIPTIELGQHMSTHCDDSPFECPDCAELFEDLQQFLEHMHLVHGEPICVIANVLVIGEESSATDAAGTHDGTEVEGDPLELKSECVCVECAKPFYQFGKRNQMACDQCQQFLNTITATALGTFKCDVCDKEFPQLINLKMHRRLHSGVRPYKCTQCPKTFVHASSLKVHIHATHSKVKHLQCSMCGFRVANLSNLKSHMRTHSAEKRYECYVCHKRFSRAGHLREHLSNHYGEQKYCCNECGKGFAFYSSFRKHQRIHLGEKPYACQYCDKAFVEKATLAKHAKVHDRVPRHVCRTCDQGFFTKVELRKHKQVHRQTMTVKQSDLATFFIEALKTEDED